MRVKLILNPIAGRGTGEKIKEPLLAALKASGVEHEVSLTGQRGAGLILARQAAADGFDIVISAGGDGTVNEIVNGIAGSRACLGVIPAGTGNDFAAMMEMPKDPVQALDQILHGSRLPIDLCRVNDRYYASSVGAGFDGEVAYTANHKFQRFKGMAVYVLSVFSTVLGYKPRRIKLTIDGETMECTITLVAVANSRAYGGGMKVTPAAVVDDGLFEICLARKMSPFEIAKNLPRFVKGTHGSLRQISFHRGSHVVIECDVPLYYQADGEVFEANRLEFSLIPRGLVVAGAGFAPSAASDRSASEQR